MSLDYNVFMQSCSDWAEMASIVQQIRDMYWRDKDFLTSCNKLSLPEFQDKFDTLTLIGENDYGAIPSQMIYAVRQRVLAWEADANIRAMLGLPPS